MEDVLLLHGFDYLSIYFFFSPQKIELSTSFHKRSQGCPQKFYDYCYKIKKEDRRRPLSNQDFSLSCKNYSASARAKKQSFKIMISSPRESNLAPPKLFSIAQQFFMKKLSKNKYFDQEKFMSFHRAKFASVTYPKFLSLFAYEFPQSAYFLKFSFAILRLPQSSIKISF